ncbi:MAG: hypothetical protein RhofKO_21680 [Rhodothermales bacterium]
MDLLPSTTGPDLDKEPPVSRYYVKRPRSMPSNLYFRTDYPSQLSLQLSL